MFNSSINIELFIKFSHQIAIGFPKQKVKNMRKRFKVYYNGDEKEGAEFVVFIVHGSKSVAAALYKRQREDKTQKTISDNFTST